MQGWQCLQQTAGLTACFSYIHRHPSEAATATDEQGTDVIEIEDDVVVGSKRKLKSAVWEDFDKICVNGKWKARCKWCTKQ